MNNEIDNLRREGMGYKKIAAILNMSENTVKSYCRRHPLEEKEHCCLNCGKEIKNTPHKKEKKFCSDECRLKWWNSHLHRVNRKSIYTFTCPYCGRTFTAYGNANRKYCSRSCFAKARSKEVCVNG